MSNIILFTKQLENFIPKVNGKFRFYSDGNPLKVETGSRTTILPTSTRVKAHGGIEHVTMSYGYNTKLVTIEQDPHEQSFAWNHYYEFDTLETFMLKDYIKHTGNEYIKESIDGTFVAAVPNRQYEATFNLKHSK